MIILACIILLDADTFVCNGERYRLAAIDAPETRQACLRASGPYACGRAATDWLRRTLDGSKRFSCRIIDRGRYGRHIVVCANERGDIGRQMVRQGWARAYVRYGGAIYLPAEREAKAKRRGIWAGRHVSPWRWRRGIRIHGN